LLDGSLEGSGRLRWTPTLEGEIELSGSGIDPAVLVPELPGDLQLELQASGGSRDGVAFARIDTATVSGVLRDLPVDLQLRGQLDDGRFDLQGFRLASGETLVTADGQAGDRFDLDWSLSSPKLGDLLPEAKGSIEGAGHVGGTLSSPTLRASLQGTDMRYAEYALNALALEADIDLERPAPSSVLLSLKQGALGAITLEELELTGDGTRAAHEFKLVAASSLGSADLQLAGELQDTAWEAQLTEGSVQYVALDRWTLSSPHAIQVTADKQTLGKGCWASGDASLCLEGGRDPQRLAAWVDLQDFALTYLQPLLPTVLALEGLLEAKVSLTQPAGQEAELDAQLSADGVTLYRLASDAGSVEPELLIALEPSRLRVRQDSTGLSASLAAPFKDAGGITGQMNIEPGSVPFGERPLRGEVDINLPDIELLTAVSAELEHAAGALRGQFELTGSIKELLTQGKIELRDGAAHLATPGLQISKINVDARTTGPQALEFTGEAQSGKGTLAIVGTARLAPAANAADITINGDAFQVVDTPDARVFVSPTLNIAVRDTGTKVTGEVVIPRAEITPRKLPPSAVSASSDQVIVTGDSDAAPVPGAGVEARVRVNLGNDVSVDGFGFKGRLTGGLLVEQVPNRPTLGTGELKILDGEYRAYGQGLVIEEGNILFAGGPIEQPGIQVRAVRRPANNILVGVRVRGPVQAPEFDLFSEPTMSQTETLSWLVLGRPLAGSSEGQEDMLAQAATMLGLKGGNYLADRFGGDLGVDSIGFETGSGEAGAASDVNQAALVIGKYLSPDLFVSYGIGLFDAISTIRLEYTLNKSWSLSTESSTETSGGDVNYVIER
jgi:translocation and assembly module TamB